MEFRDFCSTSMGQLPAYDPHESGAIDNFWATMEEFILLQIWKPITSIFCHKLSAK